MGKYISNKSFAAMAKAESERRSSESFFSSKEGDNFFGNAKGNPLRIVGLEHVKANGEIGAFNVVKFDDGHQMSTSKFFAARGLKWPVGGNVAKLGYIASALETGTDIEVTPQEVKTAPMKRRDGTFVGPRDEKTGKNTTAKDEKTALQAVTYYFEEQELPAVEMVDFSESAE
jgi:hypothetical protein